MAESVPGGCLLGIRGHRRLGGPSRHHHQPRRFGGIGCEVEQPTQIVQGASKLQRIRVGRLECQGTIDVAQALRNPVGVVRLVKRALKPSLAVGNPAPLGYGRHPLWVRLLRPGKQGVGLGELPGGRLDVTCGDQRLHSLQLLLRLLRELPGSRAPGFSPALPDLDFLSQPLAQEDGYLLGQIVLQSEEILPRAFQGLAPDLRAVAGIDQRDTDPKPVTGLRHVSGDQRAHLERPRHAVRRDIPCFIRAHAVLGDHLKRGHLAQLMDECLGQPVRHIAQRV